jgi:hypothetical protein
MTITVEENQKSNPIMVDKAWKAMCKLIATKYCSEDITPTDSVEFYESALKNYIGQSATNNIHGLGTMGIFNKYHPAETPLVLFYSQKNVMDLFPELHTVFPLQALIDMGLAPPDVKHLSPHIDTLPTIYVMFWSFNPNFNLFGCFYKQETDYDYIWATYDRVICRGKDILESGESLELFKSVSPYDPKTVVKCTVDSEKSIEDYAEEAVTFMEINAPHSKKIVLDMIADPTMVKKDPEDNTKLDLDIKEMNGSPKASENFDIIIHKKEGSARDVEIRFKKKLSHEEAVDIIIVAISIGHKS